MTFSLGNARDTFRSLARIDFLDRHLDNRRNNFTAIRFVLASLVLVGHSFALVLWKGHALHPPFHKIIAEPDWIGSVAVNGFFFISGLLIVRSYFLRRNLHAFMRARIYRIFPASIVCLTFCVWLLGPLFSTLPLRDYLSSPQTHKVFFQDIFLWKLEHFLPGLFEGLPNHAFNGSMWTLPAELRCYLVVAALGLLGVLNRRWSTNLAIAIFIAYAFWDFEALPMIADNPRFLGFAAYFAAGAFCFANARFIPLGPLLLIPVALAYALMFHREGHIYFTGLLSCYAILIAAFRVPALDLERVGDFSYGLYLYAFPMQQAFASLFPRWGPYRNAAAAYVAALLLAVLSWHFVEKRALALAKNKRNG